MSWWTTCNLSLSPASGLQCRLSPPTAPALLLTEKSTSCPLSASSWTPSSVTHSPHPACLAAWLTVSVPLCFSSCLSQAVSPTHPQSPRPSWAYCILIKTASQGRQEGTWTPLSPTVTESFLLKKRMWSLWDSPAGPVWCIMCHPSPCVSDDIT